MALQPLFISGWEQLSAYELKKVLESMKGVVIVPNHQKSMSGIEEAMDDIRHGRVTEYESADDMFEKLGI